jgi:hypothetical protein
MVGKIENDQGVIKALQDSIINLGKFETQKATTSFEDAMRFGECRRPIGDITQTKGNGHEIGRVIGKRQLLGIGVAPVHPIGQRLQITPLFPCHQHRFINVGDMRKTTTRAQETLANIASAASQIDQGLMRLWCHPVDHRRFPQPMHTATHQIIHKIIAVSDRIKDAAHQSGLVSAVYLTETEIDAVIIRSGIIR